MECMLVWWIWDGFLDGSGIVFGWLRIHFECLIVLGKSLDGCLMGFGLISDGFWFILDEFFLLVFRSILIDFGWIFDGFAWILAGVWAPTVSRAYYHPSYLYPAHLPGSSACNFRCVPRMHMCILSPELFSCVAWWRLNCFFHSAAIICRTCEKVTLHLCSFDLVL